MTGDFDITKMLRWSGVVLIAFVGAIHLILSPEHFKAATYIGVFFLASIGASLVAAANISRDSIWGWVLGFLTVGGAFTVYILSRLITFPRFSEATSKWGEPIGILALIVEAAFVLLFLVVLATRRTRAQTE